MPSTSRAIRALGISPTSARYTAAAHDTFPTSTSTGYPRSRIRFDSTHEIAVLRGEPFIKERTRHSAICPPHTRKPACFRDRKIHVRSSAVQLNVASGSCRSSRVSWQSTIAYTDLRRHSIQTTVAFVKQMIKVYTKSRFHSHVIAFPEKEGALRLTESQYSLSIQSDDRVDNQFTTLGAAVDTVTQNRQGRLGEDFPLH